MSIFYLQFENEEVVTFSSQEARKEYIAMKKEEYATLKRKQCPFGCRWKTWED